MRIRSKATGVAWALAIGSLAAVLLLSVAGSAGASQKSYPRAQTLITSGTQWGSFGFNPYAPTYATGMIGLNLETLLRYDPIKDKYINWLAKSAKWTAKKQFTIVVRSGVKWSNGKAFTPADVRFNLMLLRFKTSQWNNLYPNFKSIVAKGHTVVITFKGTPNYVQWQNALWNIPMISPVQGKVITSAQALTNYNPGTKPIGTGPYVNDPTGLDPTTRVVWVRTGKWWAAKQGLEPMPKAKYVIDLVNTSNTNSLNAVLQGVEDLNNNFLPGVDKLVQAKKVQTYYKKVPYMLSANTAWLEPNTAHKPLNDPVFRRALADALQPSRYAKQAEGNLVLPAKPTGLLPTWSKYNNKAAMKKYGFTHNVKAAKQLLKQHGYKLSGGYFTNKDGSKIDLSIIVPQGWSDWETARDMIISDAKAAGIRIHTVVGSMNTWISDRGTGNYDLALDNHWQISDNPYTHWNGIFHLPILKTGTGQVNFNFERYTNQNAWSLVKKLDKTPLTNTTAIRQINTKLQTILMRQLPVIPLWYNGQWAQFTSGHWKNWPAAHTKRQWVPIMWNGYLQMTGVDMIAHLKQAK